MMDMGIKTLLCLVRVFADSKLPLLTALLGIHSIEAKHLCYLRSLCFLMCYPKVMGNS